MSSEWDQQRWHPVLPHAACSSSSLILPWSQWLTESNHNAQAAARHMTAADSRPHALRNTHDCNTLLCRHVEMLRDDMSLLKKEMQTSHADITGVVSITTNIDARFHMLESEMHGFWKKMKDDETAKADKAAAAKSQSSSQVSSTSLLSIMTTNVCEPSQCRPVVLPTDTSVCTMSHCFVQTRRSLQWFRNTGSVMTVTTGHIQW